MWVRFETVDGQDVYHHTACYAAILPPDYTSAQYRILLANGMECTIPMTANNQVVMEKVIKLIRSGMA